MLLNIYLLTYLCLAAPGLVHYIHFWGSCP